VSLDRGYNELEERTLKMHDGLICPLWDGEGGEGKVLDPYAPKDIVRLHLSPLFSFVIRTLIYGF